MKNIIFWLGLTILSGGLVALFQLSWDDRWGLPYIVDKGSGGLIDLWSLVHVAVGVLVAKRYFTKAKRFFGKQWKCIFFCLGLTIAFSWEGFEFLMEAGAAGEVIRQWYGGHEHWTNRLLLDPLAPLVGLAIYRYNPRRWRWARVFCVGWWLIMLFMPDCMGIHDYVYDCFIGN